MDTQLLKDTWKVNHTEISQLSQPRLETIDECIYCNVLYCAFVTVIYDSVLSVGLASAMPLEVMQSRAIYFAVSLSKSSVKSECLVIL